MTSELIRDPITDHLITAENSALILIDYQPTQFSSVRSMDPDLLLKSAVTTVKAAKLFGLPVVNSTVNVSSGQNKPTVARADLERVTQAGGKPISWVSLMCELQRDWARQETVPGFVRTLFTERLSKEHSGIGAVAPAR